MSTIYSLKGITMMAHVGIFDLKKTDESYWLMSQFFFFFFFLRKNSANFVLDHLNAILLTNSNALQHVLNQFSTYIYE